MKRKYPLLIFLFTLFCLTISSQEYNETKTHIFWQEDRLLTQKDFQGNESASDKSKFFCDSLDMCCMASLGTYTILDIPKDEKDRGPFLEKAYFVPMFQKTTSYILRGNDSIDVKKQQIVFDIYELSARHARKELEEYQKTMNYPYGLISIMFSKIKNKTEKFRDKLVQGYTSDVYLRKRDGSFDEWRILIDEKLEEVKEYATTDDDRSRAYSRKPIDKSYVTPKYIID